MWGVRRHTNSAAIMNNLNRDKYPAVQNQRVISPFSPAQVYEDRLKELELRIEQEKLKTASVDRETKRLTLFQTIGTFFAGLMTAIEVFRGSPVSVPQRPTAIYLVVNDQVRNTYYRHLELLQQRPDDHAHQKDVIRSTIKDFHSLKSGENWEHHSDIDTEIEHLTELMKSVENLPGRRQKWIDSSSNDRE
jgi:hypothetical protein